MKSNQQSKHSGHLIEVMGPKGSLFAGSVAWVEGAGMEISNSSLPAQKEGAGRQEASCGKAANEHTDGVKVCQCQSYLLEM